MVAGVSSGGKWGCASATTSRAKRQVAQKTGMSPGWEPSGAGPRRSGDLTERTPLCAHTTQNKAARSATCRFLHPAAAYSNAKAAPKSNTIVSSGVAFLKLLKTAPSETSSGELSPVSGPNPLDLDLNGALAGSPEMSKSSHSGFLSAGTTHETVGSSAGVGGEGENSGRPAQQKQKQILKVGPKVRQRPPLNDTRTLKALRMEVPADGSRHAAMAETSAVHDFYQRYVPDDETSDASDSLRVFKGLVVLRLMNADGKPALVGPVEDLFIGSLGVAYNRSVLQEYGITHILTIGMSIRPKFPDDYTYLCLQVRDTPSENLSRYFDEAVAFIDEALAKGGRVLCHCFAGRSRSSTVVCAYLMRKHRLRLDKALQLLRVNRPQAQPNAGFMMQLRQLEKQLFGDADSVELSVQPSRSVEAAGGGLGDPLQSQNDDPGSHDCVCSP